MPGILPDQSHGGRIYRNQDGTPVPSTVDNAYSPNARFTMSCPATALGDDCSSRLSPAQVNALVSEMLALAEAMDPTGNWDCNSLTNLANAFNQGASGLTEGQVRAMILAYIEGLVTADSVYTKVESDARFVDNGELDTRINALVDSAPGALDTLNELAAALGDDPNFATTMTNALATKVTEERVLELLAGVGGQTYHLLDVPAGTTQEAPFVLPMEVKSDDVIGLRRKAGNTDSDLYVTVPAAWEEQGKRLTFVPVDTPFQSISFGRYHLIQTAAGEVREIAAISRQDYRINSASTLGFLPLWTVLTITQVLELGGQKIQLWEETDGQSLLLKLAAGDIEWMRIKGVPDKILNPTSHYTPVLQSAPIDMDDPTTLKQGTYFLENINAVTAPTSLPVDIQTSEGQGWVGSLYLLLEIVGGNMEMSSIQFSVMTQKLHAYVTHNGVTYFSEYHRHYGYGSTGSWSPWFLTAGQGPAA